MQMNIRKVLNKAAGIGAFFAAGVGATAEALSGGLTAGEGFLIGYTGGALFGGIVGVWIELFGNKDQLVERGEAFNYLYTRRNKSPLLANPSSINRLLDSEEVPSYDINEDGRKWYSIAELELYTSSNHFSKH